MRWKHIHRVQLFSLLKESRRADFMHKYGLLEFGTTCQGIDSRPCLGKPLLQGAKSEVMFPQNLQPGQTWTTSTPLWGALVTSPHTHTPEGGDGVCADVISCWLMDAVGKKLHTHCDCLSESTTKTHLCLCFCFCFCLSLSGTFCHEFPPISTALQENNSTC